MRRDSYFVAGLVLCVAVELTGAAYSSELRQGDVESTIVPSPVEYNILLPEDYESAGEPFPLVLFLHGGTGDRSHLTMLRPLVEELWKDGSLRKMVLVTPSVTKRSFYMDFKNGSERWETFIIGQFLDHLRENYKVSKDPKKTFVSGLSMGGEGSLRIALKHPGKFGAVAALEPAIMPVLKFSEVRPKHHFYRGDDVLERAFGNPIDTAYWEANNPAAIVAANPEKIRSSGLEIYLECGDEDAFWLYEGAEFLHQILWDNRIRHEYHLVRAADHLGPSLAPRLAEALKFVARVLNPWQKLDLQFDPILRQILALKAQLKEKDHYMQGEAGQNDQ
jgi:S-formylglutathione hydrolase